MIVVLGPTNERGAVQKFWESQYLDHNIFSELKLLFDDFVLYGRPSRDIKGIKRPNDPEVVDDCCVPLTLAFVSGPVRTSIRWKSIISFGEDPGDLWTELYEHMNGWWKAFQTQLVVAQPSGLNYESLSRNSEAVIDQISQPPEGLNSSIKLTKLSYAPSRFPRILSEGFYSNSVDITSEWLVGPSSAPSSTQTRWPIDITFGRIWYVQ